MNKLFLRHDGSHSLIIIFLGWGFEPESLADLYSPDSNILILSNYTGLSGSAIDSEIRDCITGEWKCFESECSEVVVIGWSFGVKVASSFLLNTKLPTTLCLAVNGTEHHIDDSRGIPEAIFNGTLVGLNEQSFEKFKLRCAGSNERLKTLERDDRSASTLRSIDDLRAELSWFASLAPFPPEGHFPIWDKVIVGMKDRIFPPQNQIASWQGYDVFRVEEMAHIPDFQRLIDSFIVNKSKVGNKFTTAGVSYSEHAISQRNTATKLYELFNDVFDRSSLKKVSAYRESDLSILELGFGDGMFTDCYFSSFVNHSSLITLSDICQSQVSVIDKYASHHNVEFVYEDAESIAFLRKHVAENSRDIIFSSSMFQWLNSPRNMMNRCAVALKKKGIMALSYYGAGTFNEIQETIGVGLKYPSVNWILKIARESGLSIEICDVETKTMFFNSPIEALRHVKLTGVNALNDTSSHLQTKLLLNNWPLDENGKAKLTFCPVYIILSKD